MNGGPALQNMYEDSSDVVGVQSWRVYKRRGELTECVTKKRRSER